MDTNGISDDNNADLNSIDFRSFQLPLPGTRKVSRKPGPPMGFSDPKHFPLLGLPPELRLLIYELLVAIGDLSVMRTNKLVYEEVVKLIKKNGVLRMNFGYADRTSLTSLPLAGSINLTGALTIHTTPTIQQVELRFNMGAAHERWSCFDAYTNLIKSFSGRCIARQSCTIFLDLGVLDWVPDEQSFARGTAWQAVTTLTGFSTLILKVRRDEDDDLEKRCIRYFGTSMPQMENIYAHSAFLEELLEDYKTIREILEITLGPAALNLSLRGHCLEFHPSRFKSEESAKIGSRE